MLNVQMISLPPLKKLVEPVLPPKPRTEREEAARPQDRHLPATAETPAPPKETTPQQPAVREQEMPTVPPDTEKLMSALRKDIGRIDRDLRKERPNLPGSSMGSRDSKLGKSIAAAGKATGGWFGAPKIEPIELGDGQGRRTYKVTMPDGSHYCVVYESVGRRDGYDPSQMRSFSQPKTMSCPGDLKF
jgi:hypothetical protein